MLGVEDIRKPYMNIELLRDYIHTFKREVVHSGFKRDLDDYVSSSLAASQNNIVALREISDKILTTLEAIYSGDLPEQLTSLLPANQAQPFTATQHDEKLRSLIDNTEVDQQEFFNQLNQLILLLRKQIQNDILEIEKIEAFIQPYLSKETERIARDHLAMLAVVFKERQTITSLQKFAKTLTAWNRTLPIYHQLIKSEPPADIEIVEIQNGSIDCVINLDVNVALDLVEVFRIGFQVFAAYLSYKKMIQPLIESYHGNQKLIRLEEEREALMLDNIKTAIQGKIEAQHKAAKKLNEGVDDTAVQMKVDQVKNLFTAHIVRGNDLKLLALPQPGESAAAGEENTEDKIESLRVQSVAARRLLREIPVDAQQRLLDTYGQIGEAPNE